MDEEFRLGKKIAKLRKEAGLTQEQLAEKTGLQRTHILRIESLLYFPKEDTLQKIAKALGKRLDII